jgi:hypothetical protein
MEPKKTVRPGKWGAEQGNSILTIVFQSLRVFAVFFAVFCSNDSFFRRILTPFHAHNDLNFFEITIGILAERSKAPG